METGSAQNLRRRVNKQSNFHTSGRSESGPLAVFLSSLIDGQYRIQRRNDLLQRHQCGNALFALDPPDDGLRQATGPRQLLLCPAFGLSQLNQFIDEPGALFRH